jgi:ABC-type branched-subunit amino acid transport system ATPase component
MHRDGDPAGSKPSASTGPADWARSGIASVPALALHATNRSFGPVPVLHDISIDQHPGELHAPIGEDGAGKSTTMKVMAGYPAPTSGEVRLGGQPVAIGGNQVAGLRPWAARSRAVRRGVVGWRHGGPGLGFR